MIGEITQRVPDCGELPVQNGDDARLGRVENHIVHAVVTVDQADGVVVRNILRQPGIEAIHVFDPVGFRSHVGFAPAVNLAGEIVRGLAKPFESDRAVIERLERCQRFDLRIIDRRALLLRLVRQCHIPEHPPLDHLHDVEHRAGNTRVFAQNERARHRESRCVQR